MSPHGDSHPALPPAASGPDFADELASVYQPLRVLGRGRAGTVWHARETSGRRTVAIKVARRDASSADVEFRRCQREARVARRLRHRHCASVVDAGVRGDVAYCAWRFCERGTVADRLRGPGAFSIAEIRQLVREVASALEHAGAQGVWHGALSPHALLIDSVGCCQVADFRIVEDDEHPEDELPLPARSPAYHAPELRRDAAGVAGRRVDQYAFALIVHDLLVSERRESTVGPLLAYVDAIDVSLQQELRPGLPLAVNAVLHRATNPDPDCRYETVGDFAVAFEAVCLEPSEQSATLGDRATAHTGATEEQPWGPQRERPTPALLRAVLLVAGLAGGVGVVVSIASSGAAPASPHRQASRAHPSGLADAVRPDDASAPPLTPPTAPSEGRTGALAPAAEPVLDPNIGRPSVAAPVSRGAEAVAGAIAVGAEVTSRGAVGTSVRGRVQDRQGSTIQPVGGAGTAPVTAAPRPGAVGSRVVPTAVAGAPSPAARTPASSRGAAPDPSGAVVTGRESATPTVGSPGAARGAATAAPGAISDTTGRMGGLLIVPIGVSAGAVAVVDDSARGPVPSILRLTEGEHRIALVHPRRAYVPAETTVTVRAGRTITVNFRLRN